MQTLWHPYTQMHQMAPMPEVVGGQGAYIHLADGRQLLDATSAWWCLIHGYCHPKLNAALHEQVDQLSHVMLGGLTHAPAQQLADKLVSITPDGLNHVFFSDSGSVGMEVAMKMAVQYWAQRGAPGKHKMVAFQQAYHGDTSGCMAVCDPEEGMHHLFSGLLPQQYFLPAPTAPYGCTEDDPRLATDLQRLASFLDQHHQHIAALVIEPLLQAAGGFNMYSAAYLRQAQQLCRQYQVLMIFDEVATGFGRTGQLFASDHIGMTPDIMVLSKGLTGGYLGHAATLATSEVFDAFKGSDASTAFMHGPTFMGNPLACRVALASIQTFEEENYLGKIAHLNQCLHQALDDFTHEHVISTRVLGATGVIEVKDAQRLEGISQWAAQHGVWIRPFGRYLYTMPAYIIDENELNRILSLMKASLDR
ncbi:adenosylmethionine--8-amino-7-oxononanoate transaminase [Terasakiispira papahanaumokuakeensis]|uniref:Adenosylmethionine-8-amino-7-oxononanoate aminotransferase n=1 Tax=Terasakiispira papahanaumokuakeensis TaxID=197479 RepID=A0A1E2VAG1_9GAMM|nr:adenosylmethionine--8-amino-7-oxononanoate transaminase [Terasakiispira papahanaumokuakeensis]ODC03816.1 adenosylmethionine--8-amino-7-oxononanoate transaminase [Terasakiispira papahanaumokuakeensis]